MSVRFRWSGIGIQLAARNQWAPSFRNHDPSPPLSIADSPELAFCQIVEAGRSWSGSTQDVLLTFSEAVSDAALSGGGTASGYTVYVNGAPFTPTYQSGSGTMFWAIRISSLVKNGDRVEVTYSRASGATIAVSDSIEISDTSKAWVENDLTKRIRFIMKGNSGSLVANETVKAALFEYDSGTLANALWMNKTDKASVLTDGAGLFDMQYTGVAAVGSNAYVAVIRASESFIWNEPVT